MPKMYRLICIAVLLLCGQASVACASPARAHTGAGEPAPPPRAEVVDSVALGPDRVHQLSGIAYRDHNDYFVVSDKGGLIASATIEIDRETGRITKAELGETMKAQGGVDLEDIAIDRDNGLLLVCDEASTSISSHHIDDGSLQQRASVFGEQGAVRPNLGLESLTISPDGRSLWTANEEALPIDGPRATATRGTRIRLQQLDAALKPIRQYFYLTDPHMGAANLLKRAQCGVVGLVALEGGRLIVMERALGGSAIPSFRIRLYLVDTRMAENGDAGPSELDKTLLAEVDAGFANYEGITLGPRLNNGDYALLLVSDDGGGDSVNPQRLMSLRVPASLVEGADSPAAPAD